MTAAQPTSTAPRPRRPARPRPSRRPAGRPDPTGGRRPRDQAELDPRAGGADMAPGEEGGGLSLGLHPRVTWRVVADPAGFRALADAVFAAVSPVYVNGKPPTPAPEVVEEPRFV